MSIDLAETAAITQVQILSVKEGLNEGRKDSKIAPVTGPRLSSGDAIGLRAESLELL